jgi:hypothetical protein
VFRQNEIWNDEKLENRIAQTKNISLGMAKEELAFWIDNICVLFATGEELVLPGLGRLYVSKQAKLMIEQESENLLPESFGLDPIDMQIELTEDELKSLREPGIYKPSKPYISPPEGKTNGWIIGIIIIAVLAAIAIFAVFRYILTDETYIAPPATPAVGVTIKTPDEVMKYKEYLPPRYGIVLSAFDTFRAAREFSRTRQGTEVYCLDKEAPYSVILTYPSLERSDNAIDSLKTIYLNAYIIKLPSRR